MPNTKLPASAVAKIFRLKLEDARNALKSANLVKRDSFPITGQELHHSIVRKGTIGLRCL